MTEFEKILKNLHDLRKYLEDKEWSDETATAYIPAVIEAEKLLKEQEEQKRKWLQAIADNQLAVSPTGYETEEGLARKTGEWNGLQMAWDILMEGR